jgi:hypothetical protein
VSQSGSWPDGLRDAGPTLNTGACRTSLGPGGDPNVRALTRPGPSRTYVRSAGGASGPTGQVLYNQGGRLVGVVGADAENAQWCKAREIRNPAVDPFGLVNSLRRASMLKQ